MRNLHEYPITLNECQSALLQSIEARANSKLIGGTEGLCFSLIREFLSQESKAFEAFLEKNKV